jgi:hypothetical protein
MRVINASKNGIAFGPHQLHPVTPEGIEIMEMEYYRFPKKSRSF